MAELKLGGIAAEHGLTKLAGSSTRLPREEPQDEQDGEEKDQSAAAKRPRGAGDKETR